MPKWVLAVVIVAGACAWGAAGAADSGVGAEVPRHDLSVGRRLTWSISATTTNGPPAVNETETSEGTFAATVLRRNGDGSSRVLFRLEAVPTETPRAGRKVVGKEYVVIDCADVFPDGRMVRNESMRMSYPHWVLPALPADAGRAARGWEADDPEKLGRMRYEVRGGGDGGKEYAFAGVEAGLMAKVYQSEETLSFRFDRARGAIVSVEGRRSDSCGYQMTQVTRVGLKSDERVAGNELAGLVADYDLLLDARRTYAEEISAAERDPAHADAHLATALACAKAGAARASGKEVKDEFARLVAGHGAQAKALARGADEVRRVLGKPAPDWAATDVDGKPVRMADLRGKVVVLDFWYRACGYCLMAMPQVRGIAEDFAGKPVVVLGMNTDEEAGDGRLVAEVFGLRYPIVRAKDVAERCGVAAFPTLLVVDQAGTVRGFHVGYSRTLRADVGKEIGELLQGQSPRR